MFLMLFNLSIFVYYISIDYLGLFTIMKKTVFYFILISPFLSVLAQNPTYWQQKADYKMDLTMDVKTYLYKGKQQLVYTNNSTDTLKKVYYHLYNNAFQPGSEMDMRLQNIKDPDGRMVDKVKNA